MTSTEAASDHSIVVWGHRRWSLMSIAPAEAESAPQGDRALSWCAIARSDNQHTVCTASTAMGSRD